MLRERRLVRVGRTEGLEYSRHFELNSYETPDAGSEYTDQQIGAEKKSRPWFATPFLGTGHGTGMPVAIKDVSYTVPSTSKRGERVFLLHSISGLLRPGELTALMGPSGSGKSTLLDLIAQRHSVGKMTGEILFAGAAPTRALLQECTGYVEQLDAFVDYLTVEEMLLYSAELKMPLELSFEKKKAAVDDLISSLGLKGCRDLCIGGWMNKGISGGQRKRLNIALTLLSSPSVLILDEPTTGLDSYTAAEVMEIVKGLAQNGLTVTASIHSPTAECFRLFDSLVLLLSGMVVYFGPAGTEAVDHFTRQRIVGRELREGQNKAEWMIRLCMEAEERGRAGNLAEVFASSALKLAADTEIAMHKGAACAQSQSIELNNNALGTTAVAMAPFWWGLRTLVKYRVVKNYQSSWFYITRIADKALTIAIIAALYWGTAANLRGLNLVNISALLFMWSTMGPLLSFLHVATIVDDRQLFVREMHDGMYRPITYLCALLVQEVTFSLFSSLLFGTLLFWIASLQGSWTYVWLNLWCTLLVGITLGYVLAALAPNMPIACVIYPTLNYALLFFTGQLKLLRDIPPWLHSVVKTNYMHYAWGGAMANQFEGPRDVKAYKKLTVLQYFSLDGIDKWEYLGCQFSFVIVFIVLAAFALTHMRYARR